MYQVVAVFLGFSLFSVFSLAQTKQDPAAQLKCEKVMAFVSVETGRNFGAQPCDDNVYPEKFWACVEEKVESGSPFYISLRRCERSIGLGN